MEVTVVFLTILGFIGMGILAYASSASSMFRVQRARERYTLLQLGAMTVVRYVEQMAYLEAFLDGDLKKAKALGIFDEWTTENGLDISFDVADRLIEEAVNVLTAEGADIHVEESRLMEYPDYLTQVVGDQYQALR